MTRPPGASGRRPPAWRSRVSSPTLERGPDPGTLATAWVLLRKDLLLEWRTRARLNALVFFALATLLLFSFALGPDTTLLAAQRRRLPVAGPPLRQRPLAG